MMKRSSYMYDWRGKKGNDMSDEWDSYIELTILCDGALEDVVLLRDEFEVEARLDEEREEHAKANHPYELIVYAVDHLHPIRIECNGVCVQYVQDHRPVLHLECE